MKDTARPSDRTGTAPDPNSQLDSWKEIAKYLRRSLQTVRRWEREEGLPVHRHLHGKQGTIYAFTGEIDAWLKARSVSGNSASPLGGDHGNPGPGRTTPSGEGKASARPIMIAVLPLKDYSDNSKEHPFADGLAKEVVAKLVNFDPKLLRVVAYSTVLQYLQSGKTIAQLCRDVGVDYVLEVSAMIHDGHVRLFACLMNARDLIHTWADTFEVEIPSTLMLQQLFAGQLMKILSAKLRLPKRKRGLSR